MSTLRIVFQLFIRFTQSQSQRVALFSWPLTNSTDGWIMQGTDSKLNASSTRCPSSAGCVKISGNDEFYIHDVPTTGYSDIQVAYDIRTKGVDSGESCRIYYTRTPHEFIIPDSEWIELAQHTANSAAVTIVHTLLPFTVDNIGSFGLDFWADMDGSCYLNNVVITGIPNGERVVILSSTLRDSISPWSLDGSDSDIVHSSDCPSYSWCYRLSGGDELYTHVDARGYNQIHVSYDILTNTLNSTNNCSFWSKSYKTEEGNWTRLSQHDTNRTAQSISRLSLPSDVDDAFLGLDFWANMSSNEYCYINNIVVSGLPITSSSSSNPSPQATSAPSETFSDHPSQMPSVNPTKGDMSPSDPPTAYANQSSATIPATETLSDDPTAVPSTDPVVTYEPTTNATEIPYGQSTITQITSKHIPSASNMSTASNIVTTSDTERALDTTFGSDKITEKPQNAFVSGLVVGAGSVLTAIVVVYLCKIMCGKMKLLNTSVETVEFVEEKRREPVPKYVEDDNEIAVAHKDSKRNMVVLSQSNDAPHPLYTETNGIAPDEFVIEDDDEKYGTTISPIVSPKSVNVISVEDFYAAEEVDAERVTSEGEKEENEAPQSIERITTPH